MKSTEVVHLHTMTMKQFLTVLSQRADLEGGAANVVPLRTRPIQTGNADVEALKKA